MRKNYVDFECVHIADVNKYDLDEMHALAYADIDGYTADENEEGTVICRVWLLRSSFDDMETPKYITDWHYNAYRSNERVLELIKQVKEDLQANVKNIMKKVFERAYDRYKVKWMYDHGYSITELIDNLRFILNDGLKDINEAFKHFETSVSFGNVCKIWPDKKKFYRNEWTKADIMKRLLDEMDYEVWSNCRSKLLEKDCC